MINWRHQYDEERDRLIGDSVATVFLEESQTQQHFAEAADINNIVRSFGITDGAVPPVALDPRYFGDFADVPDFRGSLDAIRSAQAAFDALPARLRTEFDNDPIKLWAFVNDPRKTDEAIRLGLLKTGTVVDGVGTEFVPQAAPPPST